VTPARAQRSKRIRIDLVDPAMGLPSRSRAGS
jgi:hypothetical protein